MHGYFKHSQILVFYDASVRHGQVGPHGFLDIDWENQRFWNSNPEIQM